MQQRLRQRLIGAVILMGLAVVLLPLLLEEGRGPRVLREGGNIPAPPEQSGFTSRIVPLEPADLEPDKARQAVEEARAPEPATTAERESGSATEEGTGTGEDTGSVRVGVSAWVVQLGSFSSEENASKLLARLKEKGYAAFLDPAYTEQGKQYRVRVGPELTRAKADALRKRLARELKLQGIIVRYP
ncbi:MAG: SPOR domain-containing protein [Gammaproteobacteria bacterium]|nr:MAG: SPOR domain-containing protein [Gammaproteobacteria bacterium]